MDMDYTVISNGNGAVYYRYNVISSPQDSG